jgi:hypothetical protein
MAKYVQSLALEIGAAYGCNIEQVVEVGHIDFEDATPH